jgi:predicted outer membrane repeat protein
MTVGGDGLSWTGAKKTVMSAVASAHAGDEIWVVEGTYAEAIGLFSGISLYGGFAGIETDVSQRNVAGRETIIDGSSASAGSPALHVVTLSDVNNVRLDGFTITGGEADGEGGSVARGGGLYATNAANTVVIANCRFVRNAAPHFLGQGGGAYVVTSEIRFENCSFQTNSAGELGGAWSCYGGAPVLQGCTFSGNVASSGGAMYCAVNSTVMIDDCLFKGNAATGMFGGAVEVSESAAVIEDSTFLANTGSEGGAIMGFDANPLVLLRCTFVGNFAPNYGGGLAAYGSNAVLRECTFVNNESGPRGGGGAEAHEGSTMQLSNCVFVGNRTLGSGGGVFIEWQACQVDNCTFASNTAGVKGGALSMGIFAALTARNTIFSSQAHVAAVLAPTATLTSLDHCFFSNNLDGDLSWEGTVPPQTGAASIEASFSQADGTVDGIVGFEPGETGVLSQPGQYSGLTNQTVLPVAGGALESGILVGSILSIAGAADTYSYVLGNTENEIVVFGDLSAAAQQGNQYHILDVHLGAESACVDRGAAPALGTTDIDGETRGFDVAGVGLDGGERFDIGADERIDPDSDGDGWSDGYEAITGTNPALKDTDGDGLEDAQESIIYGTDPLEIDSDGDWFTDGEEIAGGSSPTWNASRPYTVGDVDHSSECDAKDVQSVINAALGKPSAYRTDIDLSGKTDAKDVQLVINAVLNLF